jgi:histidine triad (HIT) family protein
MSLDGAYEDDNVFAKIIRGDMPSVKVYEDDQVLAFMDVFPQSPGHLLVVSKTSKARNLLEAEADVLANLIQQVQRIARATRAALQPDGLTVSQFNGEAGGQTVYHLHFHIIPRWAGKPLGSHGGGMADMAVLKDQAQRIAEKLS